ncbi:diacylglycerol/lipid kinase family protein [Oceaniglobus roseus]|uniref:diacylglycerol/lipid kinase family protein n=1 Tax=Oceaniglobus roseus TaxID=1737570 RepID=UPI001300056C|nr:diacylglycerol kinase family protein [Kandeliimicrobium roseum]
MAEGKIVVLLNPNSGKERGGAISEELAGLFRDRGVEADIRTLRKGDDLPGRVRSAVEDGAAIVVAGGGDGTICGVAEGLADTGVPMGVLPLGTFNYFARSLDIPEELEQAVEVIVNGRASKVRTGTINGRLFLNNTSIGRYPEILETREGVYKKWGRSRIAAYWSVLKVLLTLRRPLSLTIDADGERTTLRTPLVFVLNNAFQMEQQGLKGVEALKEGKLAMYLSPDAGRWGLIRQALAIAMGMAEEKRDFILLTATSFEIRCRRRSQKVALDGERLRLDSPLKIEAHLDALQVMVPPELDLEIR